MSTMLERMVACLPCVSGWPCTSARSWQLWPGEFDDDAQPILTAPTPALAECLIPPSLSNLYADRDLQREQAEPSSPWDAKVPQSPGEHWSQEQRGAFRSGDVPDRSGEQRGGIELKEAASNVLLGQQHLESGGRFVKAKLPAASGEGTAVHASSASGRNAGEEFASAQDVRRQQGAAGENAGGGNGASSKSPHKIAATDPSPFGSPAVF